MFSATEEAQRILEELKSNPAQGDKEGQGGEPELPTNFGARGIASSVEGEEPAQIIIPTATNALPEEFAELEIRVPADTVGEDLRVSARDLHAFLESRQDFSHWGTNRLEECQLVDNVDYGVFDKFIPPPPPRAAVRQRTTG